MNQSEHDALDSATAERLRKLSARPVDLSRIRAAVERQAPRSADNWVGQRMGRHLGRHVSLVRAVAASIVIGVVVVLLVMSLGTQAVLASPDRMAALHRELIGSDTDMRMVGSISEAQAVLDRSWTGSPDLPALPPEHQVMACCVHAIGTKRVACVVLTIDGQQVSIAVGESDQIRMPQGDPVTLGARAFVFTAHEGFNMLMTRQGKRFICVTSGLDRGRLEQVVGQLRW